ncbi:MAG: hypothetical protein QOD41_2507 [Cryptosporangiaceae bacterium]|nr:hypothetical protein [Cryptosporangiaceae bacterium]
MPARTAFSDDLLWNTVAGASPATDVLTAQRTRPGDPATMLVTIQVTLPGLRAALPGDPLAALDPIGAANQIAGRLHELAAQSVREVTPEGGVSTTVSLVVDRPGSRQTGLDSPEVLAPAQRRPLFPRPPATAEPALPGSTQGPAEAAVPNSMPAPAPEPSAVLEILTERREAVLLGVPVVLTRREYDLLLFLSTRPGRVFTRPELLTWVWGHDVDSGERTVDVHVRRLRTKLLAGGPVITTVRGVGYRLDEVSRVVVR